MASRLVLDTHALVWYVEGSSRLSSAAKAIMDDPASEMILPAIALAEAVHIVEKGRTSISSSEDLLRDVITEMTTTPPAPRSDSSEGVKKSRIPSACA